jgi:hypothetical protein
MRASFIIVVSATIILKKGRDENILVLQSSRLSGWLFRDGVSG